MCKSLRNEVLMWLCVWSGGKLFPYGPADAAAIPKPHYLLPHLNPDWFLPRDAMHPRY